VLLGAAGCSDGSSSEESSPEASAPSATDAATKPPKADADADADAPTTDDGAFADPEGRYTLSVPADWEAHHGVAGEGIEVWLVDDGDDADGFATNINVITEDVVGMSLEDYVELSIENAPTIMSDFALVSSETVTGAAGQELAVMEYTGAGMPYIGVMAMGAEGAVVITLASTTDTFAAVKDAVYPFMLTLLPTT
jgi:hypothetical protein